MRPNQKDTCNYCTDDNLPSLTSEQRVIEARRIAMLTDIIEIKNGKTPEELHPEMSLDELCRHMRNLVLFNEDRSL